MTLSAEDASLIREAIAHLRRLAIVEVHRPGIQAVVVIGHRCKICSCVWSKTEPEKHDITCILKGSDL